MRMKKPSSDRMTASPPALSPMTESSSSRASSIEIPAAACLGSPVMRQASPQVGAPTDHAQLSFFAYFDGLLAISSQSAITRADADEASALWALIAESVAGPRKIRG